MVILLCMLAYGIYILLGDCFTSMCLAFVCSLYLRDLKFVIEKILSDNINDPNKSLINRIILVRFFVNIYKIYNSNGCSKVFT